MSPDARPSDPKAPSEPKKRAPKRSPKRTPKRSAKGAEKGSANDSGNDSGSKAEGGGEKRSGERRRSGPRPMWSGSITFGLVTVPVELHSSVRHTKPRTRLLGPDGTPLQRRYKCPTHDRMLQDDEIVRGYPVSKDRFVTVTDEELEALAPERSGEIGLLHFVEHQKLPLPLIERTFYMAPKPGQAKAYRLLAMVMERAGLAGIATLVMRGHQHLAAIVAEGGVLRVELLRYDEAVRKPEDMDLPPAPKTIAAAKLDPVRAAMRELYRDELDLDALHDDREDELARLAEEQLERGEGVVAAPDVPVEEQLREHVVDLMEVLRQRIAEDDAQPPAA